ncbi:MAG: glycosyltransferase [Planctomycetes bacterium]|nr:glycosyltransferase [Planctomycetota bacterium]
MPETRYIFLSAGEGFPSTVFASQVGDLLGVLSRAGINFEVLGFDPFYPRNRLTRRGRDSLLELSDRLPGPLKLRPFMPYEDRIGLPFARRLLSLSLDRRPTVIHARGVWAAALAARVSQRRRSVKFLYDVRGDYVAEHAFHHTGRGDARGLRVRAGQWRIGRAERRACDAASRLLCVSNALRTTLEGRYPGAGVKAAVIPSGHDPRRFFLDPELRAKTRKMLGLEDAFVLVYAGSMVPYQLPEALARLGQIACELHPKAHLLILTQNPETARGYLIRANLPLGRSTCIRVPHSEVPAYLSASDLGLLLRRRDPVNRAASPTKVAEYLASGVPVLVGPEIGDTSELVVQAGLGAVLDDPESPRALRAALGDLLERGLPSREHVAKVAQRRFARDRFLPTYLDLYGQLSTAAQRGAAATRL